jgi:cardiolipin synthase
MFSYLLSHASAVLAAIGVFVAMTGLVGSQRTSQSTLAWLLAIVFAPWLAIPLFLLLGKRKFLGVRQNHVAPARPGNSFELLPTGELAYARLLELINGATSSIDLTMFIVGRDPTGDALIAALAERAKHGVSVRVILDAVGCIRSRHHAASVLCPLGAEVRVFMPLTHSPIRGRTNLRSHRKLAVFDDERVFAGGMNLAEEYMGPRPKLSGEPRWRDVAAVCSGPVASDALAMFASDWAFCGGTPRPLASPRVSTTEPNAQRGDAVLQLVASGPDFETDTLYDLFLSAIFGARERISLVTPYYVPDELLQHALVLAARRGVRTEVVVPAVSNHRLADVARRSLLRELSAAGVRVHYYPHGMVHAKGMVVDDSFAYVGSPNFDMRSFFLNYENALCAYSPAAVAAIFEFIQGLVRESHRLPPAGRERPLLEQLARFLAPEL